MSEGEDTSGPDKAAEPGCSLFVLVYLAALVPMYFLTLPEPETKDFHGRVARLFTVAAFPTNESTPELKPRVRNLEEINSPEYSGEDETFLLPQSSVSYQGGNPHIVKVLEQHDSWQLVEFHYSNTRTATSVYRAYADRVEPVSFEVTSHVGQAFNAILLVIPAWIVSKIIAILMRRKRLSGENA